MKPVAVLMSGGVDSSVAAYLIVKKLSKQKKSKVIGITLKFWECNDLPQSQKQLCCSAKDVYDAKNVAAQLGIKHYVIELKEVFNKKVIEPFCKEYLMGFTPNPCIICNKEIKFGFTYEKLRKMFDIDTVVTGHYARIVKQGNKYFISAAKDKSKDQSYFLSLIGKDVLKHIRFPLGNLKKDVVRTIAQNNGLKVADKKDSFEICFIPQNDYRQYLIQKNLVKTSEGKIVDIHTKTVLGKHLGYFNYTIGQRTGLQLKGIYTKKYVVDMDVVNNIVYIGDEKDLYKKTLIAKDIVVYDKSKLKEKLYGKIRFKSQVEQCNVKLLKDVLYVNFIEPQRAITPGQYVVIYNKQKQIICAGKIFTTKVDIKVDN